MCNLRAAIERERERVNTEDEEIKLNWKHKPVKKKNVVNLYVPYILLIRGNGGRLEFQLLHFVENYKSNRYRGFENAEFENDTEESVCRRRINEINKGYAVTFRKIIVLIMRNIL